MDLTQEIKRLKDLLDQGAITEEEFAFLKSKAVSDSNESMNGQIVTQPDSLSNQIAEYEKNSQISKKKKKVERKKVDSATKITKYQHKESLVQGENELSNITVKKARLKKRTPTNDRTNLKFKKNEQGLYEGGTDSTVLLLKGVLFIGLILGFVFWYRYNSFFAFLLSSPVFIAIGFIVVRQVNKLIIRNMLLLSISLFMILLISIPIGGNNDTKSSSNSSSVENSNSSMKYCSKHSRSYNPDNAWKGCPDCVNEQDQKAMEKALEKSRRL